MKLDLYKGILIVSIATALFVTCQTGRPSTENSQPFTLNLPPGFPEPEFPENNLLTKGRVAFGKMLFYDKALSIDSTMSCGSCHLQEKGFADNNPVSIGIEGRKGFRNAPTLTNVAYHPYFFKEGGNPSLELQVVGPICNQDEMGFNAPGAVDRLKTNPEYQRLAQENYNRDFDLFVMTRAIAAFERTLISGNSPYDQYKFQGKSNAMSQKAIRGMELFFSPRTGCANCHNGIDFSNYAMENIGLYTEYKDKGRFRATSDSADIGKFKVPTLRNIALTHPYMHDGSLNTLEEVIELYSLGGKYHPNKNVVMRPRNFTDKEKQEIIAFLHSLTDDTFIQNPEFAP